MKKRMLALMLCIAAVAIPAEARVGQSRCYGTGEAKLAHIMLEIMPYLGRSLIQHEREAKLLRLRTCLTIAKTGRVPTVGHTDEFYRDPRNHSIRVVADDLHINRARLLAALVDAIWPPQDI